MPLYSTRSETIFLKLFASSIEKQQSFNLKSLDAKKYIKYFFLS